MRDREQWRKKWKRPKIKHGVLTKYNYFVHYPKGLKLGRYIDIGQFVYIQSKYGVEISDDVSIGPHTSILSESTIDNKEGLVRILKNSSIGSHCTIMPCVTIGENVIIGAHSFVNRDIPDNCVAYGVPCRVVKKKESVSYPQNTRKVKND
jgi:acetyltransferase-like isoleucine patch superfamily enzyme